MRALLPLPRLPTVCATTRACGAAACGRVWGALGVETLVVVGVLGALATAAGFWLALAATTRKARQVVSFHSALGGPGGGPAGGGAGGGGGGGGGGGAHPWARRWARRYRRPQAPAASQWEGRVPSTARGARPGTRPRRRRRPARAGGPRAGARTGPRARQRCPRARGSPSGCRAPRLRSSMICPDCMICPNSLSPEGEAGEEEYEAVRLESNLNLGLFPQ